MKKLSNIKLVLEGLNCANCAVNIERKVNEINDVDSASLNFATKILTIKVNNNDKHKKVKSQIKSIVKSMEPHVEVRDENEKIGKPKKTGLILPALGIASFVCALIFKFPFQIDLTLYLISYLLLGGNVVISAVRNIFKGKVFDENFLMSVATIGAFAIGQFPEAVSVMLFYRIGEYMQDMAVNRSRDSISKLLDIKADFANLKIEGKLIKVVPEKIKVGDVIVIKPGERVPLDGVVIKGSSTVDTSDLTGEPVPRHANEGDEVLSGFINESGVLTVKVTKEFEDSAVSKILELVENASSKKAHTEKFITKFARYYTPAVVFTALALAVIPSIIYGGAAWIYRALVFLVISCPCALVISIPLSFFGGIGRASSSGILIKGGNYLEALSQVDTVVFDKTGTLTKGVFKVTKINPVNNITKEKLLEYAAVAESYSNHPIAVSIMNAYGKPIASDIVESYDEISGYGVAVKADGKNILAGSARLMEEEKIDYDTKPMSETVVHVAVNGKYAGFLTISDEVKKDSKEAVTKLKNLGIKNTVMLTGDNKETAENVAKALGIDKVYAQLLPHKKVEILEKIRKEKTSKGKIIFVGDGINDAPVLTSADVGIAMGGLGSDAAIQAADMVIMNDEPSKLADALKISKITKKIVWQNIIFILAIKIVVLVLGAAGIASMWAAVFADVGVALIAVLNSIRILKLKKVDI